MHHLTNFSLRLFFGYLFLFGSIVMVFRGWKPGWFSKHRDAQPIAGIPYHRTESASRWIVAIATSLILASAASWAHRRIAPEHPHGCLPRWVLEPFTRSTSTADSRAATKE
jgi:hypothetical protein